MAGELVPELGLLLERVRQSLARSLEPDEDEDPDLLLAYYIQAQLELLPQWEAISFNARIEALFYQHRAVQVSQQRAAKASVPAVPGTRSQEEERHGSVLLLEGSFGFSRVERAHFSAAQVPSLELEVRVCVLGDTVTGPQTGQRECLVRHNAGGLDSGDEATPGGPAVGISTPEGGDAI